MDTRLLVVLMVLILAVASSGDPHVSPKVSSTALVGNEQQRRHPLAVLQADTTGDDGIPPPSELEIFSEDPNWDSKVLLLLLL